MSVLIAIKDKSRIVVGVDTRMSSGPSYMDSYKQRPKAYHMDNKRTVIVGGVGNIGLVDVMKIIIDNHMPKIDMIDRSYIVKFIIPELINDIKVYSMEDKECRMDGELFLGIKDRAYTIHSNYTVEEVESYVAIGSGMDVAIGSLFTSGQFITDPESRIAIAVQATGHTISSVSSEPIIGDTAGKLFTLYKKK